MEEKQARNRAHDIQHPRHGLGKFTGEFKPHLNDVHYHRELKLQETQKKKTGNGKLNSFNPAEEKAPSDDDSTSIPDPLKIVRARSLLKVGLKQCLSGDVPDHSDSMDGNNKTSMLPRCEKESTLSLNGEVAFGSGYITNGYSSRSNADNEGSGSESGYTTPKKRKPRRSSVKGVEIASRGKEKAQQRGTKSDPDAPAQEMVGKLINSRPNCTRTCLKTEVQARTGVQEVTPAVEGQDNSDAKSSGPASKKIDDRVSKSKLSSSATTKDDSWTLFKPPPVFPVDNSSAKIVPKISYASKVKENLNKAAELTQAQSPQVPVSALKMVTSASFANSPVSGEAKSCHPTGTCFTSAASATPSASSNPGEGNVASDPESRLSSSPQPSPPESRKLSGGLFVYPHKPLNMQPALSGVDAPAPQTNQKALGDIFQNQWGLSFINEPNAGPEGTSSSRPTIGFDVARVTFQGQGLPFLDGPGLVLNSAVSLPAPWEHERRTSVTKLSLKVNENCPQKEELKVEMDLDPASLAFSSVMGPSKAHTCEKGPNKAERWVLFDLPAAVLYHTKEFEYLATLHKQDPKRVVYYEEATDRSDH